MQHRLQRPRGQAHEGNLLATGANRAQQLLRRSSDQQQQAPPRLLQGFKQGVGGALGHRLHPLQHHQTARRLHGPPGQEARHLPNLLQAQLGRRAAIDAQFLRLGGGYQLPLVAVGGLQPKQIGMVALRQPTAFMGTAAGPRQYAF